MPARQLQLYFLVNLMVFVVVVVVVVVVLAHSDITRIWSECAACRSAAGWRRRRAIPNGCACAYDISVCALCQFDLNINITIIVIAMINKRCEERLAAADVNASTHVKECHQD